MTSKLDYDISNRISILRYLMIVGIIIMHVPPYVPLNETSSDIFSFIKAFFSHGIFRSTTPILTCIASYLLFSSNSYKSFKSVITSKSKSLLVPMIFWNLPWVLLLYLIQSKGVLQHDFSAKLYPFNWLEWINGIFGIFASPVNYPLNFLRDLYALFLLAPIFGFLLKHSPFMGGILVALIFWNNLDGPIILRDSMAINFYLGGMAAILNWDLKKMDRYAAWLLLAFLLMCFFMILFKIDDRKLFSVLAPFSIWPFSALIVKTKIGNYFLKLSKYSFFIFLSHSFVLLAVSLAYSKLFGDLHTPLFWLTSPLIVVVITQLIYEILEKTLPGLLNFSLGGRSTYAQKASKQPSAVPSLQLKTRNTQ